MQGKQLFIHIAIFASAALLTACGGGGSSGSQPDTNPDNFDVRQNKSDLNIRFNSRDASEDTEDDTVVLKSGIPLTINGNDDYDANLAQGFVGHDTRDPNSAVAYYVIGVDSETFGGEDRAVAGHQLSDIVARDLIGTTPGSGTLRYEGKITYASIDPDDLIVEEDFDAEFVANFNNGKFSGGTNMADKLNITLEGTLSGAKISGTVTDELYPELTGTINGYAGREGTYGGFSADGIDDGLPVAYSGAWIGDK